MFDRLRKKQDERRREKARAEFERAAAESDPAGDGDGAERDSRRARDIPDQLGEEMRRVGASPPGPL